MQYSTTVQFAAVALMRTYKDIMKFNPHSCQSVRLKMNNILMSLVCQNVNCGYLMEFMCERYQEGGGVGGVLC